jgi:kumamolisin
MRTRHCTTSLSTVALAMASAFVCTSTALAQLAPPFGAVRLPAPASVAPVKLSGPAVVNIASPSKPSSSVANPSGAGQLAHTFLQIRGNATGTPQVYGPPFPGLGYESPQSLACVYKLVTGEGTNCNPNDPALANVNSNKGSNYIAIVDAFDSFSTIYNDLATYNAQFGVSAITYPNFQVWYTAYGTPTAPGCSNAPFGVPSPAAGTGWDLEESLDVEMAHAMAPGATILLVEAQSNSLQDLACAEIVAGELIQFLGGPKAAGEVSNSWGGPEFSVEKVWDSIFTTPDIVYLASSGDGPGVEWPSASPNLISAGGTSISRDPTTLNFLEENVWDLGGGGPSVVESQPAFQCCIAPGATRDTPDISFDANPATGVWVFNSTLAGFPAWFIVGGTSVSSPALAGIINAAGRFYASSQAEGTEIYNHTGDFTEITDGNCGPYNGYEAKAPYNFCAGVGSDKGYKGK